MPQSIDLVAETSQELSAEIDKLEKSGVWRDAPADDATPVALTSRTYRDTAALASPGVVNIFTQKTVIGGLYSDPLGVFPFKVGIPIPHRGSNLGSGFLIGAKHVVTSRRVVAAAQSVEVQVPGFDLSFSAKVLGAVPSTDVALLEIEPGRASFTTLALGSSAAVSVGEPVLALGNPLGTGPTARDGIVSFRASRLQRAEDPNARWIEFFQTTAHIQLGDTGGPLVNLRGAVIGMNVLPSAEGTPGETAAPDSGYAVPIDVVKSSVAQILSRPSLSLP